MNVTASEEIAAPIAHVFAELSDVGRVERAAVRRGIAMQRRDTLDGPCAGMTWDMRLVFRDRPHEVALRLTRFDPPCGMVLRGTSALIEGDLVLDLAALAPARTRLDLGLTVVPRSLQGRMLVQSIRLARGTLTRRLAARLGAHARDLEDRYRRMA